MLPRLGRATQWEDSPFLVPIWDSGYRTTATSAPPEVGARVLPRGRRRRAGNGSWFGDREMQGGMALRASARWIRARRDQETVRQPGARQRTLVTHRLSRPDVDAGAGPLAAVEAGVGRIARRPPHATGRMATGASEVSLAPRTAAL